MDIKVTKEMVYAFCNALGDGSITEQEFNEVEIGLKAAMCNLSVPADNPAVAVPVFSESDLIEIASSYSAYAGSDTDLYLNAWINSGEAKGFIDLINDRSAPSHSQKSAESVEEFCVRNNVKEQQDGSLLAYSSVDKRWVVLRSSAEFDRCPSHESEQP